MTSGNQSLLTLSSLRTKNDYSRSKDLITLSRVGTIYTVQWKKHGIRTSLWVSRAVSRAVSMWCCVRQSNKRQTCLRHKIVDRLRDHGSGRLAFWGRLLLGQVLRRGVETKRELTTKERDRSYRSATWILKLKGFFIWHFCFLILALWNSMWHFQALFRGLFRGLWRPIGPITKSSQRAVARKWPTPATFTYKSSFTSCQSNL